MGLIYISLSVACSLTIAHFLKVSERSESRILNVLCINYITAATISFFLSDNSFRSVSDIPEAVILLAVILGLIFIANLFVYSASIDRIGMGISIAAMRMSLAIPVGISLFLYNEQISGLQYAGMFLVFVSLYLLLPKVKAQKLGLSISVLLPVFLFVMTGIADASLKVYEREFAGFLSEYAFLGLIFFSAFIIGISLLVYKKELSFSGREILYGIIVGLANLYSSYFLILALQEMKGSIVFPITNISNVVLGALIGIIIWKDNPSNRQKGGLILALISILILI
ncbi:MAG: hypothetical protein ACMZ7B_13835 [Balneola sp.]